MGFDASRGASQGPARAHRPPRSERSRTGRHDDGRSGTTEDARRGRTALQRRRARPRDDRPLPVHVARGLESSSRRRAGARSGRAEYPSARADRGRRRDHAVQRRHHHGVPEVDPGVDGRQLGDPAAESAHAAVVVDLRCCGRCRRAPARRVERGGRGRRSRCRAAHDRPGDRHGVVHRLHRGGQADPGASRADGEAGGAGTGWQVGTDLSARRGRTRGNGCRRGRRALRGPGVRRCNSHVRAARTQGRSARRRQRGIFRGRGRTPLRPDRDDGAGDHRRSTRSVRSASSPSRKSTAGR